MKELKQLITHKVIEAERNFDYRKDTTFFTNDEKEMFNTLNIRRIEYDNETSSISPSKLIIEFGSCDEIVLKAYPVFDDDHKEQMVKMLDYIDFNRGKQNE